MEEWSTRSGAFPRGTKAFSGKCPPPRRRGWNPVFRPKMRQCKNARAVSVSGLCETALDPAPPSGESLLLAPLRPLHRPRCLLGLGEGARVAIDALRGRSNLRLGAVKN